jgi:CRP/FNR family cyclic AMP-dependent transcriptional regulator
MTGERGEHVAGRGGSKHALDADFVARIAERGVVRSYPSNAIILHQGDPDDTFAFILSGRVSVLVGVGEGRTMPLDTLGPCDYVGLLMLDGQRRSASIMTLTPVKLCLYDRAQVEALVITEPYFARRLLLKLIERVRVLTGSVASLALLDVKGRVVHLLKELARDEGELHVVRPRVSQREIARRVGASPAMVNMVFRELIDQGVIIVRSNGIVVR